jgi:hypothetical protein
MNKDKKFNCYNCEYREPCAGSAHSQCKHPSIKKQDPMVELMAIFASVGRVTPPDTVYPKSMHMKFNEYGVRNGWCIFPVNFDPLWIENCDGYKSKTPRDVANAL